LGSLHAFPNYTLRLGNSTLLTSSSSLTFWVIIKDNHIPDPV
jgi:predicted DNA-binding transcriptional regulator AlpA